MEATNTLIFSVKDNGISELFYCLSGYLDQKLEIARLNRIIEYKKKN